MSLRVVSNVPFEISSQDQSRDATKEMEVKLQHLLEAFIEQSAEVVVAHSRLHASPVLSVRNSAWNTLRGQYFTGPTINEQIHTRILEKTSDDPRV